jgi:hypothetical protein
MLRGGNDHISGHRPVEVRRIAQVHGDGYLPGDMDVLMASVSPNGGVWAGLAPPDGAVTMRTADEIRSTYTRLLGAIQIVGEKHLVSIATDWYVFFENVATLAHDGADETFDIVSVDLFTHDDTGRTSTDMAWTFPAHRGAMRPNRVVEPGFLRSELVDLAAHDRRRQAFVDGDAVAAAEGLTEDGDFFVPCFDPDDERLVVNLSGAAAYRDFVQTLFDRFEIRATRPASSAVGDSYVFSEVEWDATDRHTGDALLIRYALVEIFDGAGSVEGMLGYAITG